MRTIWKFPIHALDAIHIDMPQGAEILWIAVQDGRPHLWASVDPEAPIVAHHFMVAGTGQPIKKSGIYRGSWFDGSFVWHLIDHGEMFYAKHERGGEILDRIWRNNQ